MRRVGARAFWVATIGVAAPFALGTWVVGLWLLPGLPEAAYLFLGAALTATSVGITGRVFRDAGVLQRAESQIVLGAAVIDDVLGLIILAVVASIATRGTVDASKRWRGRSCRRLRSSPAPWCSDRRRRSGLSRGFAKIHRGAGMKLTVALAVCLVFAYVAHVIGLAPIVGAFAAGLVLEEVHFRDFEAPRDPRRGARCGRAGRRADARRAWNGGARSSP